MILATVSLAIVLIVLTNCASLLLCHRLGPITSLLFPGGNYPSSKSTSSNQNTSFTVGATQHDHESQIRQLREENERLLRRVNEKEHRIIQKTVNSDLSREESSKRELELRTTVKHLKAQCDTLQQQLNLSHKKTQQLRSETDLYRQKAEKASGELKILEDEWNVAMERYEREHLTLNQQNVRLQGTVNMLQARIQDMNRRQIEWEKRWKQQVTTSKQAREREWRQHSEELLREKDNHFQRLLSEQEQKHESVLEKNRHEFQRLLSQQEQQLKEQYDKMLENEKRQWMRRQQEHDQQTEQVLETRHRQQLNSLRRERDEEQQRFISYEDQLTRELQQTKRQNELLKQRTEELERDVSDERNRFSSISTSTNKEHSQGVPSSAGIADSTSSCINNNNNNNYSITRDNHQKWNEEQNSGYANYGLIPKGYESSVSPPTTTTTTTRYDSST